MVPSPLFSPLRLRELELSNRIALSSMCQYSAVDGLAEDWHLVHYGSRAALGLGLINVEATAIEARGRITPADLGLWSDAQVPGLARIVAFAKAQGAAIGLQLAHAGRKGGCARPWEGGAQLDRDSGGWERVSASALPFREGEEAPRALSVEEIAEITRAFVEAARRADEAGFDHVEIHAAHGYLLHQFLSPLSNHRDDAYGGSFEGRARFLLETVEAVRWSWPSRKPLLVRLSATDWAPGGWDLPECVVLAGLLAERGVDLIDVSSGGLVPSQAIKTGPGYQVPFAEAIRRGGNIPTGAVGLITGVAQAEEILSAGRADLVFLGRELLRNPGWAWQAMRETGSEGLGREKEARIVPQYLRARREWA